jgi:hypothetical protein
LTLFWKFVFPALFGLPFAFTTVKLVCRADWHAALSAIPVLHMIAVSLWFCPRYMIVHFDDNVLYVSNGLREIHIPWSQVARIQGIFMSRRRTYSICFRSPTEFGGKIFFSTPFGRDNSIIQKMREKMGPDANAEHHKPDLHEPGR